MTALRALWYADYRMFRNGLWRLLHSPTRLILYFVYLVGSGYILWQRVASIGPRHTLDITRADTFMCLFLAAFIFSTTINKQSVALFRNRVEARFITSAPIAAPLAIAYMQTRAALGRSGRLFLTLLWLLYLLGPRHIGPWATFFDLGLLFSLLVTSTAIAVPRRLLTRSVQKFISVLGVALIVIALLPILRDFVSKSSLPLAPWLQKRILIAIPALHPGKFLLSPQPLWTLAFIAVAMLSVAILSAVGRDAYPELYALSVARFDHLNDEPVNLPRTTRGRSRTSRLAPAGVLILVWKSAVELSRKTSALTIGGIIAIASGLGFIGAHLVFARNPLALITIVVVVILIADSRSSEIGEELRRPIFWLAKMTLFERLCALAVSRSWPALAIIELVAMSFAAGGGALLDTLMLALGLPALVGLLVTIGFAIYASFPLESARPALLAGLRLIIANFCLIPCVAVLLLTSGIQLFRLPIAGIVSAMAITLVEAALMVAFASRRLAGGTDKLRP